jgi:hypothetical protein
MMAKAGGPLVSVSGMSQESEFFSSMPMTCAHVECAVDRNVRVKDDRVKKHDIH